MKFRHEFVLALGVLVLGISSNAVTGQSAARKCSSEECACEKALTQNTVKALENFLRKYPRAAHGTSACAALAVPPDDEGISPEGQSHDESDSPKMPASTPSQG